MPFPARTSGTCNRCHRPYVEGEPITSTTGPTVLPARFEHSPRCPITPVPAPPLPDRPDLIERSRAPYRIRGRLDGNLFEITIDGLPVEMVRIHEDGVEIRVTPAALMAEGTGRRTA